MLPLLFKFTNCILSNLPLTITRLDLLWNSGVSYASYRIYLRNPRQSFAFFMCCNLRQLTIYEKRCFQGSDHIVVGVFLDNFIMPFERLRLVLISRQFLYFTLLRAGSPQNG
jgi:hypothetical protein